jgi:hypothetical protein
MRQVTSRCIWYSEFIPLAHIIYTIHILQLLPLAVSELYLLLESLPFTRYHWLRRLLQFNWTRWFHDPHSWSQTITDYHIQSSNHAFGSSFCHCCYTSTNFCGCYILTGLGDFTIHTLSLLITQSVFFMFPIHTLQLHSATSWFTLCVTPDHRPSYKPLVGQWTTCLVSLLHCHHLVYQLPSSSGYTARLLPDIVFTDDVRQRCQSCLLLLSNQRASAWLGSLRLYSAWHGETPLEGGVFSIAWMSHNMFSYSVTFQSSVIYYFVFTLPNIYDMTH